jgi:hypothetical protein
MTNEEIARFFNNTRAFIKGKPDLREVKFTVDSCGKRVKAGIPGTGLFYSITFSNKRTCCRSGRILR